MRNNIICADVFDGLKTLPDESVHCIVTSIPYFQQRDYGVAGQIGLESSLPDYIQKMTAVFRECRRVLRKDGTLWLNVDDSYNGSGKASGRTWKDGNIPGMNAKQGSNRGSLRDTPLRMKGLADKSLCLIPQRLVIALADDGWIVRCDNIWYKRNAMPASVQDRPTRAHEYLYLLSKATRYWYDQEAVREKAAFDGRHDTRMKGSEKYRDHAAPGQTVQTLAANGHERWKMDNDGVHVRNMRSVWDIPTQGSEFAHFATFPEALPERCIKAGCPPVVCAKCGAPHIRQVEKHSGRSYHDAVNGANDGTNNKPPYTSNNPHRMRLTKHDQATGRTGNVSYTDPLHEKAYSITRTTGWLPSCNCDAGTLPGIVLDPFMGSGTTALVARRLGRDYIGIDLNPEYVALANKRLADTDPFQPTVHEDGTKQLSLFSDI